MKRRTAILIREEGVAFVEFALALPLMLLLFINGFELARLMLLHQKADKIAYTVADVVAQYTTVTQSQLNTVLMAAGQIMLPNPFGTNGIVHITSVNRTGTVNPPVVRWRHTGGGYLAKPSVIGTVGANAALPNGLTLNDKDNVIVAEVYYRYTPALSVSVFGEEDIYKVAVFKPRLGVLTTPPI